MTEFTKKVIDLIRGIPKGKVASYGTIALCAGNPSAARQVARILHSSSRKYKLPWHRVLGKNGEIRLPQGAGYEEQIELLRSEGVNVIASQSSHKARINMEKFELQRCP